MKKLFKNKNLLISALALTVMLLAVQIRIYDPGILQSLRNLTFDGYQQIKPRNVVPTPIRIVDIDDASLRELGQWPWPRTRISRMIENMSDMGAAAISFDVAFAETDRTTGSELIRQLDEIKWPEREKLRTVLGGLPDNDRMLAFAMGRSPVILGFFSSPDQSATGGKNHMPVSKGNYAFGGEDPTLLLNEVKNSVAPLEILENAASGIGIANPSLRIRDDIIRRVPIFVRDGKTIHPSLAVETLRVAQSASTFIIKSNSSSGEINAGADAITEAKVGQFQFPLTSDGEFNVYFAPEQISRRISAFKVVNADVEKLRELFEGHIVLVGASAAGLQDLRKSSLGETVPGVTIHAQVIDQIMTGVFLSRPDWVDGAEVVLSILACVLLVLILPFVGVFVSAAIGFVLAAAIVSISWYAFAEKGLLIDPVFPTMLALAIFLFTTILRFAISEREKRFVRSAFQHYLAPDLLQKLEESPESLKLGGEIRDLTLMFMDIRGFTAISEKLSPQELVAFLNELLSPLSDIIHEHEGAIDKYIGDSIMAFWNAPLDVENHERKAAICALKMQRCVDELNAINAFEFKSEKYNLSNVEIGIGLNSGEGCVGNMGSSSRFDYSVVGDTVNVAARIESSCKGVGWPLLISQSTADQCSDFAILSAGTIELKGKTFPAPLFALLGDEEFAKSDYFKAHLDLHNKMIAALEKKGWQNGGAATSKLIARCREHGDQSLDKFYNNFEQQYC